MTIEALRSSIEAEGIPAPAQHIYHNGQLITDNAKTLQELNITDGDMLALHVRDMRGSGVDSAPPPQVARRRPAGGAGGAQPLAQDPELIRLHILGDPAQRRELERVNPALAAAIEDPPRFAQIFQHSADQAEEARLARIRQIEALNRDEFNPDAQARIEAMIREERVQENLQNAMEHNPESFGRVHLLYINVKVNGHEVKALVDSGAQATIMSPSCAEQCNIMHLVDKRFAGIARGVGTAKIIGRVHSTVLQVGSNHLHCAFTVMEGKAVDLLLGLDILKGHQATIDLARNKLIIRGEEVEFLGESDIPKETEDAVNDEPTVPGPGGTTIGARSGAVTGPSSSTPNPSGSSVPVPSRPQDTAPPTGPSAAAAPASRPAAPPTPAARTTFPESDINALLALGCDRQTAIHALQASNGNVEYAAGLLFPN